MPRNGMGLENVQGSKMSTSPTKMRSVRHATDAMFVWSEGSAFMLAAKG